MKVKPLGDYILIKPKEHKQVLVSEEGVLSEYGDVVSIGPDVKHVKPGDQVGFSVFGVEKLIIDEEKYYFIREGEFLLCTIVG